MKYLLLLLTLNVHATVGSQLSGTADTNSTKVLNERGMRNCLNVTNIGSQNVYLKLGSAHSATEGLVIFANSTYEFKNVPVDSVYLKTITGSTGYNILECVK